jgi:hypothetical protein
MHVSPGTACTSRTRYCQLHEILQIFTIKHPILLTQQHILINFRMPKSKKTSIAKRMGLLAPQGEAPSPGADKDIVPGADEVPVIEDPVIEDPVIEDPVIEDPVIEDPVIDTLVPGADEAVVPGAGEAVVPGAGEAVVIDAVVPGADEAVVIDAVVPGADDAVVPGADEAVVPGADEAVVPGADEAVVPGADEAVVPGADEALAPGADEVPAVHAILGLGDILMKDAPMAPLKAPPPVPMFHSTEVPDGDVLDLAKALATANTMKGSRRAVPDIFEMVPTEKCMDEFFKVFDAYSTPPACGGDEKKSVVDLVVFPTEDLETNFRDTAVSIDGTGRDRCIRLEQPLNTPPGCYLVVEVAAATLLAKMDTSTPRLFQRLRMVHSFDKTFDYWCTSLEEGSLVLHKTPLVFPEDISPAGKKASGSNSSYKVKRDAHTWTGNNMEELLFSRLSKTLRASFSDQQRHKILNGLSSLPVKEYLTGVKEMCMEAMS